MVHISRAQRVTATELTTVARTVHESQLRHLAMLWQLARATWQSVMARHGATHAGNGAALARATLLLQSMPQCHGAHAVHRFRARPIEHAVSSPLRFHTSAAFCARFGALRRAALALRTRRVLLYAGALHSEIRMRNALLWSRLCSAVAVHTCNKKSALILADNSLAFSCVYLYAPSPFCARTVVILMLPC